MVKEYAVSQVNVKMPSKLFEEAEIYAKSHSYVNIQELIRETLRDRLLDERVRPEYIHKLLTDPEYQSIGIEESRKVMAKWKKRLENERS